MAQAAYRRSGRGSARRRSLGIGDVARDMRDAFVEHNLLTYAAAVAFQMIVALLPLIVLGLALLGAFGIGHLWAALVSERNPPDAVIAAPAAALAEARRACAARLAAHTAADGTLRIPVEALLVERAG